MTRRCITHFAPASTGPPTSPHRNGQRAQTDLVQLPAQLSTCYVRDGAPGIIVYNAVLGAPDQLLSSSAAHLQEAYAVDVIGAGASSGRLRRDRLAG